MATKVNTTNEEVLNEIQARKDQLLAQSKKGLDASISEYNVLMQNRANAENAGALNSYKRYMPLTKTGTSAQIARSAYLNRLGNANEAAMGAIGQMNANRNIYGAYMDSAGLNADSNINALGYKDYVNQAQLAYQMERDRIADKQADKEYALDVKAYKRARRGGGGGYRSSGGGGGKKPWKDTLPTQATRGYVSTRNVTSMDDKARSAWIKRLKNGK